MKKEDNKSVNQREIEIISSQHHFHSNEWISIKETGFSCGHDGIKE